MNPTTCNDSYKHLLETAASMKWQRIGTHRRSGVCAALFSVYSSHSIGIGEIPDITLLIDWSAKTGNTIVQLLPLNDTGFAFRPYDSVSSFALDPMYLSLAKLEGVPSLSRSILLKRLKKKYSAPKQRVDYQIKSDKLDFLWRIFKRVHRKLPNAFHQFMSDQSYWLHDYSAFVVLKEEHGGQNWELWESDYARRNPAALWRFRTLHERRIHFHEWIQWQLYEQMRRVKTYASSRGVLLMGDMPFLVSRDSADVWSHQNYFKLDFAAGAPPDAFFAMGQRWGMPPYCWEAVSDNQYEYVVQKLKYLENFYDMFRIDHVVGTFRVWSIPLAEPLENGGLNGRFDPADQNVWEEHGRRIIDVLSEKSQMLPCAEDLGVVPDCSYRVLNHYGIPGTDVVRWTREWGQDYEFSSPDRYRKNAMSVISTHDMASFAGWWLFEAGTVDRAFYARKCLEKNVSFDAVKERLFDLSNTQHDRLKWRPEITDKNVLLGILQIPEWNAGDLIHFYRSSCMEREKFLQFLGLKMDDVNRPVHEIAEFALTKVLETTSIFSIQMLQDWLTLDPDFKPDDNYWNFRINFPGTIGANNWSIVMPWSLEELQNTALSSKIRILNEKTGRIPNA